MDADSYDGFLVWRIVEQVDRLDAILQPTVADRYRANIAFGAVEDKAVLFALEDVDERTQELRRLLGGEAPR